MYVCVRMHMCVLLAASDTKEQYVQISDGAALSHCYMDLFWIQERRRVTNTGTTCITTIKTYKSNSKPTLAIIKCIVNNMLTSIFVCLLQVISSLQY